MLIPNSSITTSFTKKKAYIFLKVKTEEKIFHKMISDIKLGVNY